ncbi:MerC domain-containing protein [Sphingomonas cavernae]|uniref:MerC domain-containing protein n=1 Tax=Sphingomonas cavernae TaxID=2320861 RepID=A0A418WQ29_9SPHN|nr:MerC domain-containing protein [Sphingomonas cavernae]RJF93331.1 MerC domain-containing protein [Sphingomonas cavernae]
MDQSRRRQRIWDAAAIGASAICLIHCLALPVLIAALPALADLLHLPERFHLAALALALPMSALALAAGWRRHGLWLPLVTGILGLLLLGWGALGGHAVAAETGLTVVGSILLTVGHVANWRAR